MYCQRLWKHIQPQSLHTGVSHSVCCWRTALFSFEMKFCGFLLLGLLQVHAFQVDRGAWLCGPHPGPVWLLWASAGTVSCWWGYPEQHGWTPVQVWSSSSIVVLDCSKELSDYVSFFFFVAILCFSFSYSEWASETRPQVISTKPWSWDRTILKPGRTSTVWPTGWWSAGIS